MVPFVPFAGPAAGLGQGEPTSTIAIPPSQYKFWEQILIPVGQSVGGAVASRIAYGKQQAPYYPGALPQYLQPGAGAPYPPYGGGLFGGIDPSTLLVLGVGALALVMVMGRR